MRTAIVSLTSVASVRPGCGGITIVYSDGTRFGKVRAWAVQKANLSTQLGRDTRADHVAAMIKRRADDARRSM